MLLQGVHKLTEIKRHWILLIVLIGILLAWPPAVQKSAILTAPDLCNKPNPIGMKVTVPFHKLTPTANPLVWDYHTGYPAKLYPVGIRVIFENMPFITTKPIISGIVTALMTDNVPRPTKTLGIIVISSARLRYDLQPADQP